MIYTISYKNKQTRMHNLPWRVVCFLLHLLGVTVERATNKVVIQGIEVAERLKHIASRHQYLRDQLLVVFARDDEVYIAIKQPCSRKPSQYCISKEALKNFISFLEKS